MKPRPLYKYSAHPTELSLMETVRSNLVAFVPENSPKIYCDEFEIGAGTVDLIIAIPNSEGFEQRIQNHSASSKPLSGIEISILSNMYLQRLLKIDTIARRACIDEKQARIVLLSLAEKGFITELKSGQFVRKMSTYQYKHIISIEGKLRNWKVALNQAYRNRLFSAQSYVVLDAHYSRPAINNLEEFVHFGVGLAVAIPFSCRVEIIYKPPLLQAISRLFELIAAEKLTTRIASRTGYNKNVFSSILT